MSVRKACIVVILITCLVTIGGCTVKDDNTLPRYKYSAIQEDLKVNCTLIEENNYNPMPHITPPYEYDYYGSMIRSEGYYPEVNDSLKILYGTTFYRVRAPWDTVTGLRIRGVYNFPYVCESGFVFESIDGNGTIFGSYNNSSIALHGGERWISPVYTEIKSVNGTGMDKKPYSYTARFNTTWTITNLGTFDKANLTRSNNSKTAMGFDSVY